ncbi:MAG: type I 3-dehydroquinate dehydratase [Planctomycetes bacterium]|nr:type I 3-dehydroquinate dehydratase [Planctomycetota bacterium]
MAEVIASLLVDDPHRAQRDAARAAMTGADWIELRLDRWPIDAPLDELVRAIQLPVLLSCRVPEDGGAYRGTLEDRRRMFERGLDAGVRGIDLELEEKWMPTRDVLVVRSHHDFKGIPDDLHDLRDRLLDAGDVAKIACVAHDLADAVPLFELLASSDPEREPTVAFAMGERASASRILCCALGSPFTYASVPGTPETAPGQISSDLLAGLYHARDLSSSTELAGVLGDPARHSLGPWLHNRALRAAGRDAVYLPLETSRPRELLAALPTRRLLGLSVTAPHKESLLGFCHRRTSAAEAVGAVNTLTQDAHGVWVGHNTDVHGVRAAFERAGLAVEAGDTGCVLGGGGAARAAAIALRDLGLEVTILARSLDPIREFANRHGFVVGALRTERLVERPPKAVVHATPVGSAAGPSGRLLPDWTPPPGTFVLDMVYRPHETVLLRDVAAAGAVPIPGIEMFLAQAADQVGAFVGVRPDEAELRNYLAGMGIVG